jgi:hypothetical protein
MNRRLHKWSDLPPGAPSATPESWAWDFKAVHTSDASEHAKDIAAFANAMGGVIVVGVHEKADSYSRNLLPTGAAYQAARDYEDAARDLLSPRPVLDAVVVRNPEDESLALLAVNVEPFPGQLIGARIAKTHGWRYPIRTAARHCTFLDPERAMIYSDPRTRKAAILLASIEAAATKSVYVQLMDRVEIPELECNTEVLLSAELRNVDVTTNTVTLAVRLADNSEIVTVHAPLEDVVAVWKASGTWMIRLNGALRTHMTHTEFDERRRVEYMSGRGPVNWD